MLRPDLEAGDLGEAKTQEREQTTCIHVPSGEHESSSGPGRCGSRAARSCPRARARRRPPPPGTIAPPHLLICGIPLRLCYCCWDRGGMTINADPGGRRGGDPPDGGTDADDDHEDCGQALGGAVVVVDRGRWWTGGQHTLGSCVISNS